MMMDEQRIREIVREEMIKMAVRSNTPDEKTAADATAPSNLATPGTLHFVAVPPQLQPNAD